MSWVAYALLSTVFFSTDNIIDKVVVSRLVKKPMLPAIVLGVIGLFASLAIYLTHHLTPLPLATGLLALVAGVFWALTVIFYFLALKTSEVSRVIPLFYITPVFILVLAGFWLGEIFTPAKYVGIALLVIGAVLISSSRTELFYRSKAFWLMMLANCFLALNQVITKYLLGIVDFWTVYSYVRVGGFLSFIPVSAFYLRDLKRLFRPSGRKALFWMSASAVIDLIAFLFYTIASAKGFVTLVNALNSVQPFMVLLFSVLMSIFLPHLIKEAIDRKTLARKLLAISMMFVGALLIT